MNLINRLARSKRRAKTLRLQRTGVPWTASKWGWQGAWQGGGYTPGEWQSARKLARRLAPQ